MNGTIAWIAAEADEKPASGDFSLSGLPQRTPRSSGNITNDSEARVENLVAHQFPAQARQEESSRGTDQELSEAAQKLSEILREYEEIESEEEHRRRRIYRSRTVAMLRRYMKYSIETGRLPSLLGQEFFRAKVTTYSVVTFEDRVIFVHDMEKCLERLDEFSRQMIARHVLQEHDRWATARLLHCNEKTVRRLMPVALDQLCGILVAAGLMERMEAIPEKSCQGGLEDEISASDCEESENNGNYILAARGKYMDTCGMGERVRDALRWVVKISSSVFRWALAVFRWARVKAQPAVSWMLRKPPQETHKIFGLQDLEVSLVLILFFIQVGLPMIGIQQNFWGAIPVWAAIVILSLRIVWRWQGLGNFRHLAKVGISVLLVAGVFWFLYAPMKSTYYTTVDPSFAYLAPHPYLYGCQRRAFLVRHSGVNPMPNANVVLWDNNASKGHAEIYSEIGVETPLNPKLFWWTPSNPWDEDYTISITSGNKSIEQLLIARSARGQLQIATEVRLNGRLVFKCRDEQLPYYYTVAANMGAPSCTSSMQVPDSLIAKVFSQPGNFEKADGSVSITSFSPLSAKQSGVENEMEHRHIWEYQRIWLINALSQYAGTKVQMLATDTGSETWSYAEDLADVLRRSHWTVDGPRKLPEIYDGMFDIQISRDAGAEDRKDVSALLEVLSRSGIKHHPQSTLDPDISQGEMAIFIGSESPSGIDASECVNVSINPNKMRERPCAMVRVTESSCPIVKP